MNDPNRELEPLREAVRKKMEAFLRENSTAQSWAGSDQTSGLLTGCGIALTVMVMIMIYLLSKILVHF